MKKALHILLLFLFFGYGFSISYFKIFPFNQLMALKHYLEHAEGTFDSRYSVSTPENSEIVNTFLNRLLVKKVPIPGYSGHGGGISISNRLLFLVSNKGAVFTYNLNTYQSAENTLDDVPMNFSGLIRSMHPYKNDFRIAWFRVNGVYSESMTDTSHTLYVSHNGYNNAEDCITHNISRINVTIHNNVVQQDEPWNTIFTASPCIDPVPENIEATAPYPGHISGGSIINFDSGHILATIGDYNRHGIGGSEIYAMDPQNPYGKTILVNKTTGEWSIYSMGHRNITGLYRDKSSKIWAVENGPEGGDEFNYIEANKNYGWPRVSYGVWYDREYPLPGNLPEGNHGGYEKPIFSWLPAVAPRGVLKIEGEKFNLWNGDFIIGSMRDQSLHRLRLDSDYRVIYDERIELGHRIRDFITLPGGELLLLTDDRYLIIIDDGGALSEEPDQQVVDRLSELNRFDSFGVSSDNTLDSLVQYDARSIYQQHCASCHNLNPENQIGPHLYGLLGREIGGVENYNYSNRLRNENRSWTTELLQSYLNNPENEFSGTIMQKINLSDPEIDSIIQYLQNQTTETDK